MQLRTSSERNGWSDDRTQRHWNWLFAAVLILGALTLRLDAEAGRAEDRLEATQQLVRLASQQKRLQGDARRLWEGVAAPRNARLVSCAFNALASAAGGPVALSDLTAADGAVSFVTSQPPGPGLAQGLAGLGARQRSLFGPVQ